MSLMDRNYLNQRDALDLMVEIQHGEAEKNIFLMIRSFIQNILAPDDDLTAEGQLDFLSDSDMLEDSLVTFFSHDTELWQSRLDGFKKEMTDRIRRDPNGDLADPIELFGEVLLGAVVEERSVCGPYDKVAITLKTELPPLETNGLWNGEKKVVTWTKKLHREEWEFPRMFYAVWVKPNLSFQATIFQDKKVNGDDLANFCLWFHTFADEEKAELSDFLYSLRGSPAIEETLADFKLTRGGSVDLEKWFNGE